MGNSKTKQSKEFFIHQEDDDTTLNYFNIKNVLFNKYFSLFKSNFKVEGLDYRQTHFLMKKLWHDGTIAAFKIPLVNELGLAPWNRVNWDMYGEPETIMLTNLYGSPLVPTSIQVVDKDVVIGYLQSNRKPLKPIIGWYVERIAQVDAIMYTNLMQQSMPYVLPVDEGDANKIKDLADKILKHEIIIGVEGWDSKMFNAIATTAPYILDKLQNYKKDLENDVMTLLGINNSGSNKIEQLQMAEVNSNNEEINLSDSDFDNNLKDFCDRVKETLGITISISVSQPDAMSNGQFHDNEQKTGPKSFGEGE